MPVVGRLLEFALQLRRRPWFLALAAGITVVAQLIAFFAAYLIARSIGIAMDYPQTMLVMAITQMAISLPISVAGHGVRSALEFAKSGDVQKAHAVRNPELAPHLTFLDAGGHGYATVRVDASTMVTEFVCIPRPVARSPGPDGGPLRYRVRHEVPLWRAGEAPQMRVTVVEGPDGTPVPGARVTARPLDERDAPNRFPGAVFTPGWSAFTDESGVAILPGMLAVAAHRIDATDGAGRTVRADDEIPGTVAAPREIRLALAR